MDIVQETKYNSYIKMGIDETTARLLVTDDEDEKEMIISKLKKNYDIMQRQADLMQPFPEIKFGDGEFIPKTYAQIMLEKEDEDDEKESEINIIQ